MKNTSAPFSYPFLSMLSSTLSDPLRKRPILTGILLFGVIQLIAQSPPSIVNPRSYREKDILTQISNKENSNTTFSLSFDGVNWKDYSVVRNRPLWFDLRNGQNQGAYLRVCTSRAQDCETHRIHGNNTYQIFWNKSAYKWDLAQVGEQKRLNIAINSHACNFGYGRSAGSDGIYLIESSTNRELENMVTAILDIWGISNRSFVVSAANVENAAAYIHEGKRYILYNEAFMRKFSGVSEEEYWWKVGILAHEIGHHVQGHPLLEKGSRPEDEIEADEFAGFAVKGLRATLEQAQIAILKEAPVYETPTHPKRADRLRAVKDGYRKAGGIINPQPLSKELPQPTIEYNYASRKMLDGQRWTTENLNIEVAESWCYENDWDNCDQYGRLYTWEAAKEVCKKLGKDWRLPSAGEWRELAGNYGGYRWFYYKNREKMKREKWDDILQPWVSNQALLIGGSSGFNAPLAGSTSNGRSFRNRGNDAQFWTSSYVTDKNGNQLPAYALLSAGRIGKTMIFETGASPTLGFSCRCVRDY